MIKFQFLFLLLITTLALYSQNVGVNTTNPKVALDVQGAFATRAVTVAPIAGNAVNIPANASLVVISGGSATATINALYPSAYTDGQRMIIYNTNAAGFDVLFFGAAIPLNQAREFICQNPGGWSLLSGALSTEGWGLKGNAGTDAAVNFIGTTTDADVVFKRNNFQSGLLNQFAGNTSWGVGALNTPASGQFNTANGFNALAQNTFGIVNTAMGTYALFGNTTGINNTAIGGDALTSNKTGNGNVGLGFSSMYSNDRGYSNVGIGDHALFLGAAQSNIVAVGDSALYYNGTGVSNPLTQGIRNTAVGSKALYKNTIGTSNTAFGYNALTNNNGGNNTAIGDFSLRLNTSGTNNTSVGTSSLSANQLSNDNVAIGAFTLANYNPPVEQDGRNVSVGNYALNSLIQGTDNTAIGDAALLNSKGSGNTAIGSQAGYSNVGTNNIFIGRFAGINASSSNKLYIENGQNAFNDSVNALIYGDFAADSLLLNAKTVVRNNAVVRGFTKLGGYGTDVPSIKMKKLVVTNGAAGVASAFLHGIIQSKILSVSVLINASTGNDIPPRSTYAGFEYDYYVGSTSIVIKNISGNDASIAGRPIRILITYEE